MNAVMFDTLKLVQRSRDKAKFAPEQAAATVDSFTECQENQQPATKPDLEILRVALKADNDALRAT